MVFVAPTKPLVAQQVDACHSFMGMSKAGFCELTGAYVRWGWVGRRVGAEQRCGWVRPWVQVWVPSCCSSFRSSALHCCGGLLAEPWC